MDNIQIFLASVGAYLPTILGAVLILIVGWIVALLISRLVGGLLTRTNVDDRLANLVKSDPNMKTDRVPVQKWVTTAVFWIIMLFAIVAFLQVLNLANVGGPLNNMLDQILGFIPGLLSAIVLLAIAWVVATLLRAVIVRIMGASGLSRRLSDNAQVRSQDRVGLGETVGNIVYWLVFLLFLPAILGALNLQGILAPVQNMVNEVLSALPNILAAGLILALGYLAARIIRQIVTGLLSGVGLDRIGGGAAVSAEAAPRLSNVIGTVVFVLVLIPVAIAALNALNIPAISTPAANMLTTLLNALPAIFGAVLLLALAFFVARIVGNLVSGIVANLGVDRAITSSLSRTGVPVTGTETTWAPSRVIGTLVTVAVVLFAVIAAANMLGFELLANMVSDFIVLAGNILLGLIIFGLGLYLASLADRAIRATGSSQSNILATAARAAIIVFTGALALRQMGIGEDIVNLAFGLMLGAIAVAAALAFGLGGREVAAQYLQRWRESMRTSGGGIPATGKSVGEGFRDALREDASKAREQAQQSQTDMQSRTSMPPSTPITREYPSTGTGTIPETGTGAGYRPDTDDEDMGDIPATGASGTSMDYGTGYGRGQTGTDPDLHTGMGDLDDEDTGDIGIIPNTGMIDDEDVGTGSGSGMGLEDPDLGSRRGQTGTDDEDTGYGGEQRRPFPPTENI